MIKQLNWKHESSPRVFATRDEVRRFARRKKLSQNRILQTLDAIDSAYKDEQLYNVAPDDSYDLVEHPLW